MILSYILLECSWAKTLPIGLALCLLPFLLGWLMASAFYKVSALRNKVNELTASNTDLTGKVSNLTAETTDLRVKQTQLDSELYDKNELVRKLRSDLMICEGERNVAVAKLNEKGGGSGAKSGGGKPAAAATVVFGGQKWKADDLKIVEGIGPKIDELLRNAGITTWQELSETSVDKLRDILDAAGPNYRISDPGSWPQQAGLAAQGSWDMLQKLQDELKGGR